ncbi:MAG: PHP domain-containing protein [Oscillospiraceae bacterium]|nr:PHP domain-containing protein [Oscillospiraceae bacterium]
MELFDTHVHTTLSDGRSSPEEVLAKSRELGLSIIALTDHLDMDEKNDNSDESYNTLAALKTSDHGIKLLIGVEIGQAHRYMAESDKWLAEHKYDFVLGSCHSVRGYRDFYYLKNTKEPQPLLKQYFNELTELCEWGNFDSLAHITYPFRYIKGDYNDYMSAINNIFTIIIKKEIALEINTQAGLPIELLQQYYKLGGRLLTIGSDAHRIERLADGIPEAVAMAEQVGFTECAYYENRKRRTISWKN